MGSVPWNEASASHKSSDIDHDILWDTATIDIRRLGLLLVNLRVRLDRMCREVCRAYSGFLTVIDGNGTSADIPGSDIASNTIL